MMYFIGNLQEIFYNLFIILLFVRFIQTGVYRRLPAQETLAPSMDIAVSSNLERYLYYLCDQNEDQLAFWMNQFETTGEISVGSNKLHQIQQDFMSYCSNRDSILETIKETWINSSYLLCPHSATAVNSAKQLQLNSLNTICLATAHPGKFHSTILLALSSTSSSTSSASITIPTELNNLPNNHKNKHILPGNIHSIKLFIQQHIPPLMLHLYNQKEKFYLQIFIMSFLLISYFTIKSHLKS